MLYELSGSLDKEPQIQRAIELTFAKKAPATLHKRTLAFWKLFKFHSDRGHKSGLHMSEASIFAYFESLTLGAATAPQSCLEALFFMHTLLGLRAPIDDLVSHRIRGLVYEAAVQKRPLKQARPLTVEEVRLFGAFSDKEPGYCGGVHSWLLFVCIGEPVLVGEMPSRLPCQLWIVRVRGPSLVLGHCVISYQVQRTERLHFFPLWGLGNW